MTFFSFVSLFGGLALFLYGMEVMSNGLKKNSGDALKRGLEKVTQNALVGVLTGMLVTAVIQASAATILLAVGLISAGVLNLRQAVNIVLGANIGTTVTAQIIRLMDIDSSGSSILELFKPSTLAPLALMIGVILIMFVKKHNSRMLGDIFIGFGILFSGLLNMTAAVAPLAQSEAFVDILVKFAERPVLGILAGLVITVIVQSSSATVGMVQALSSTGVLTFNMIYPLIMGINLGTCVVTAALCSIGSSKDAKRTGLAHIIFNSVGTLLFMLVMSILHSAGVFDTLWVKVVNSGAIADFQTFFNVATAAVLLPFTGLLVKLTLVLVKPEKGEEGPYPELRALDEKLFISPSVALAEASKSIGIMGEAAKANLQDSFKQLTSYEAARKDYMELCEERIDQFADANENFLIKLSTHVQSKSNNQEINILMQIAPNFERLGDYAIDIERLAFRLVSDNLTFSPRAKTELDFIYRAVDEITTMTVQAFQTNDNELAKRVEPLEEVIDDMVVLLKNRHIERLKAGTCTISAGLVFMETMTYLERAADQCSSIAMLMLGRENEEILRNHHEYLRELHKGEDPSYTNELNRQRERYFDPIETLD